MAKNKRVQLEINGKDNTKNAFNAVSQSLDSLEKKAASMGRAMTGALAGVISVGTLKKIGQLNSEWVDMSSRLRRITKDEEEFTAVTAKLGEVAESTWSGLNETIESYLAMQGPLSDMGYTTMQQVEFVSALNNALVVSGAKKEVAASVQDALNKAMASGILRGQNLNTVIEKGGRVAELLAAQLGVTVSELRKMGAQGKITGDVIYEALAGNMQLLAEEADAMPATFEDAMQRIDESITQALRDDELMQPLTESLLELAAVIKDPATQAGLIALANGLVHAGSGAVSAASEFGNLGQQLGYFGAWITSSVSDLDRIEAKLKDVDRSLKNTGLSTTLGGLWYSKEELELQKKSLETQRRHIIDAMTGTTEEMRAEEKKRQEMLKEEKEKENIIQRKYVNDIKDFNAQAVKAVEQRGKDLAKAEKNAAKEVENAKKAIADIEKKFDDIRKSMKAGADKEPTFVDYQKLAVAARQALAAGDTAKAKDDALAAANVLKELAAAGVNTYGFEGMVNSMEALAKSAAEIEQSAAEAKLATIQAEMAEMAKQAEELKEIPIGFEMDDAELNEIKAQIASMLEQLKIDAVIPVRLAAGDLPDSAPPKGFASGGHIRGPGTGTSDSILARLSNGEYVVRAAAVRKYGLDTLNSINNMRLPKFAAGGLIEAAAGAEPSQPQNLGTLNFHLPQGEKFSVLAAGDNWDELHRAALKYGRTAR